MLDDVQSREITAPCTNGTCYFLPPPCTANTRLLRGISRAIIGECQPAEHRDAQLLQPFLTVMAVPLLCYLLLIFLYRESHCTKCVCCPGRVQLVTSGH